MDDVSTQLRKGSLELAVLTLLAVRPRYGVELVDDLAGRPGLEATSGTIYPLLTRLKNSRLVDTTWRESPAGPPRKYYRLTLEGTEQLTRQRIAWERLVGAMATIFEESQA